MTVPLHPDIQSFLEYLKYEKRYSVHTLISYQTDLTGFYEYLNRQFGNILLNDMDHNIIRSWMAYLKETKLTSKSINRKISCLKSFFKYYLRIGRIEVTPMAKVISPKISKRLPVFVKEDDTKKLVEALSQSTEDWKTLNARMLITIFYATGMRLSELINFNNS